MSTQLRTCTKDLSPEKSLIKKKKKKSKLMVMTMNYRL